MSRHLENPMTRQVQLGIGLIGVSIAVGLAVLLSSESAKSAPALSSSGPMKITLQPGGHIYENVPLAGVVISLPAGATWVQGPPNFTGTSTSFATGPLSSGQQVKTTLTWKDASGDVQTTDLTLSAGV